MCDQVHCQFKHIPSTRDGEQLANNIETFVAPKVFDKNGIKKCGQGGNDTIAIKLTRNEANRVRDRLAQVLPNESSPIWFTIFADPLDSLDLRALQTTVDHGHHGPTFSVSCQFGSLRSYNHFYSHVPLDNKVVNVTFEPTRQLPNTLRIEFDDYRIVIPFASIQKTNILVNKQTEKNGVFILLPLKYTPRFYRMEPVKSDGRANKNENMKQVRLCADERRLDFLRDIAKCSDLVLHFQQAQNMPWVFLRYFLEDRPYRYEINFCNFKISDWSRENNKKAKPDPFKYDTASFQDRYALEMLITLGFVFRDKWAELTDELKWHTWNPDDRYSRCRFAVEQLCEDHGYDLTRTERDYNERKKRKKSEKEVDEDALVAQNSGLLKVAVCTLTPLRTIFQPLEVTTGSRALRNQQLGGPQRFLLVHFREEDNGRLRVTNWNIKKRLKNSMENGIDLWRKNFKYMGASTGQMKEMAFWFIDLPPHIKTITAAHNVLGEFASINNIATYIARMGQYFSRTQPVGIQLTEVKAKDQIQRNSGVAYVIVIPDIKPKSYCFTDGIGKISWGLAGRIAQRMNLPLSDKKDIPSAFQVRVAGCKGMVAIDPDSTLDDYYICVRESMVKFVGNDWNLEICDYSRPMPLTLNNQVIRLLSDLGNHDDVFIAVQNQSFTQPEIPEDQLPTGIEIAVQRNMSYSLSKDNLLTNRIPIPPKDGRNMFGVADETGALQYGECFIQYSSFDQADNGRAKLRVLTGDIIVTKNPCLWPGDFRRLKAVRNSKLEECMRDVIVFPTTGARPHPNEISGSDLDGDQYWVYWGDRFKINENVQPLSYEGAQKATDREINETKIIQHIVESFAAGVILGMIANTHTAVADQHPQHSFSEPCKKLAELFALAVDSPKTGVFVSKEQIRPYQKEYCLAWPNYMRKFGERSFESTSVLEKLFNRAKNKYQQPGADIPIAVFPQRRIVPPRAIQDRNFEKWFDEGFSGDPRPPRAKTVKEVHAAAKTSDETTAPTRADEDSSEETCRPAKGPSKGRAKRPKLPTNEKPSEEPNTSGEKAPRKNSAVPKTEALNEKVPGKLINSNPTAPSDSSLLPSMASSTASSMTTDTDQCSVDFQIISDMKIIATSKLEFCEGSGNWHTVRLEKGTSLIPDREVITENLTSYMGNQNVLKRSSPAAQGPLYGSLYLIVFYGHIYIQEQESQKFSAFQKRIKETGSQMIRFNYADIDELNIPNTSASTARKNQFEYELDCCLDSSSSECVTLLFDKKKLLVKYVSIGYGQNLLFVYQIIMWTVCMSFVLPDAKGDLIKGRRPNIEISRDMLKPSVTLISLKVIDEDETDVNQSDIEAYRRKVRYVTINEGQERAKAYPTLEYYAGPLSSKNKAALDVVCAFALSPVNKLASDETPGKASKTASSRSNGLRGFSMSDA